MLDKLSSCGTADGKTADERIHRGQAITERFKRTLADRPFGCQHLLELENLQRKSPEKQ